MAVHTRAPSEEKITIFTRSNWKWQSKQAVVLDTQDKRIAGFHWGSNFKLIVIGALGQTQVIEYSFTYHSSMVSCNQGDETGYTTVVDGVTLSLTPLGKMLMPPPMSEKQFKLKAHLVCLAMFGTQLVCTDAD